MITIPTIDYVTVDSVMKTEEEAKQAVHRYNKKHFPNFKINTNTKKSLIYHCKYAVNRDSKSKGKKVKLHTEFLGCPAKINFYKGKSNLRCTSTSVFEHNHEVSKKLHMIENVAFTSDDTTLVHNLHLVNAKLSHKFLMH